MSRFHKCLRLLSGGTIAVAAVMHLLTAVLADSVHVLHYSQTKGSDDRFRFIGNKMVPASSGMTIGPKTTLHYAPNHNFDKNGKYVPGAFGFNLADVNASPAQLNSLPDGVKGLVWVGMCNGPDSKFRKTITAVAH